MPEKLRVLDLFSGIRLGGFSLGLERAGMETIAFCEIDPFCRQVLKKHWPHVPIHEDITELDGEQYRGTVDVVCGGFPCQPFSVAGKRSGASDDRALWPEMLRVIREVQPAWVIGENVGGFVSMELDNCLSDLEGVGYACQPFVIPACAIDARHRRDRVWILGNGNGNGKSACTVNDEASKLQSSFAHPNRKRGREKQVSFAKLENSSKPRDACEEGIAPDASGARLEGLGLGLGAEPEYSLSSGPCRWPTEPRVDRVAHGVPNRTHRLRALGNAVVPQIPEILGRAILEVTA